MIPSSPCLDTPSNATQHYQDASDWPWAYGKPGCRGALKRSPVDFQVDECLSFSPEGHGDHVYLHIEKTGWNTEQMADKLARFAGVRRTDIGYAGMKDRQAITRQWFSVLPKPKTDPNWRDLESDQIKVLAIHRHPRKLKIGALKGNAFRLTLRSIDGEPANLKTRLQQIAAGGVPNYFGPQRFGHGGRNLQRALAYLKGERRVRGKHQRGLMYSVARSWIFNQVLAQRVNTATWNQPCLGDVFILAGTRQFFVPAEIDQTIRQRLQIKDIVPSGPLVGSGTSPAFGDISVLEQTICDHHAETVQGLVRAGVEQSRRPLVMHPESLQWHWQAPDELSLSFFLPAGCYATSLVRELIQTTNSSEES